MHRQSALKQLLQAYTPADDREAGFRDEMIALCDAAADPFSRDHFDPGHFTASAFILSPDDQEVLLIFHGKLHRWLQPGGHVDPTDTDIMAAAHREVMEETGLAEVHALGGILDIDIHTIPPRKGDPAHKHFDIRMLFRATSREFQAGSDAQAGQWVSLDGVQNLESDESVLRAIGKLKTMLH